jgi:heptosyltransferase-2
LKKTFKKTTHKILLIKLSALGDVLAFSPIPGLISSTNKHVIDHMVMGVSSEITKYDPHINKQIVIPEFPGKKLFSNVLIVYKLLKAIYGNQYDVAIIYHRNVLFQILCALSGIRNIFGYKSLFNIFLTGRLEYKNNVNRTNQDIELTRVAGYDIKYADRLVFYTSKNVNEFVKFNTPKDFYVINSGGGNFHAPADNRYWPIENYINLIDKLSLPVVLLGSGQKDEMRSYQIMNQIKKNNVINLVGKTSFQETAYILKQCKLFIGNDSSLLFLAAALDIPLLGLYGPTPVSAALPIGSKSFYIKSNANCSPCYNPLDGISGVMYKCNNNICMQMIDVNTVLKKINMFNA